MKTEITGDIVTVEIFPFYKKKIPIQKVEKFELANVQPLLDYGGWGIRYNPSKGWAYILQGNQGIKIWLKGKTKPLLIGTSHPEEIYSAMNQVAK